MLTNSIYPWEHPNIVSVFNGAYIAPIWIRSALSFISFVISVSQDIVKKGYAAGKIAKQFAAKIEGSGGGKPDFAQGGGKKADNLNSVIENIGEILK